MRSEKVCWTGFRTGVRLPSSPLYLQNRLICSAFLHQKTCNQDCRIKVRSTGLEPVPVAGHAPQTCAYADSATTAEEQTKLYGPLQALSRQDIRIAHMIHVIFVYTYLKLEN